MSGERVLKPKAAHTHTIILLHGRGSNPNEFQSDLFENRGSSARLLLYALPSLKWVLPCAPLRYSSGDAFQWFDMVGSQQPHHDNDAQRLALKTSVDLILSLIQREAGVVPLDRIVLAGISQGAAVAIWAMLKLASTSPGQRLGGAIGLSTWLPLQSQIASLVAAASSQSQAVAGLSSLLDSPSPSPSSLLSSDAALYTPVFLSHSQDDSVVPIANGQQLADTLTALGAPVIWKSYADGGHWVNEPQGISDLIAFLNSISKV